MPSATTSKLTPKPILTFVADAKLAAMTVGIVWLAATASIAPLTACQASAADAETHRRAISSNVSLPERRAAYQALIQACPGDPDPYIEFSSFLVANREFNTALAWIDKGLSLAPEDSVLNLRKGESLVALSEAREALAALALTTDSSESQFFRGLAYQLLEDHRNAQACFLDAWKRGSEDPYVLYSLIREDKDLGDKTAGLEHFKMMMARFPESAWIHILLGDAHFKMSEEAAARQEYLAAVKLMPDLFEPNFRLAYMDFEAGEYSSAEQYYQRALAAKPHHTEANVYLGETLRREHKFPEAIQQLRRAIDVDPESTLGYDSLSKALADAGMLVEAVDVLGKAELKFRDNSSFPAMRARILNRLGRTQESQRDARRATEIIAEKNKKEELFH